MIILADKPPLPGQGYPIYWLTEAQLTAAGDVDAVQMAGKYEPFDERLKRLTIELDAQFRESAQLVQLIRASLQELSSEE